MTPLVYRYILTQLVIYMTYALLFDIMIYVYRLTLNYIHYRFFLFAVWDDARVGAGIRVR